MEGLTKWNKKRAVLDGSLYFTGTEALCAYMKLAGLPSAYVDSDALDVDEPAASRMAVRMAHRVSRNRAAAAAIAEFRHLFPPLFP